MRNPVITLCVVALVSQAFGQSPETRKRQFNIDRSALAIRGYDPVAYFATGEAVEGTKNVTLVYEGITYQFSSVQNKELFKADPAKYEPQYGGWCAYAMGTTAEKVEIDPETFKIVNGKLYLFYNKYFNNTLKTWNKDESRLNSNADRNWSKVLGSGK